MALTLAQPAHSELVIRKSRFIGCVQAVPDRAQAQAIVAALRAAHQPAGAQLGEVAHGQQVEFAFSIPQDAAAALTARLNEAGQGGLRWLA